MVPDDRPVLVARWYDALRMPGVPVDVSYRVREGDVVRWIRTRT